MRPIWSGTIWGCPGFPKENRDCTLHRRGQSTEGQSLGGPAVASEREEISFDLLHSKDNSRIRYARICEKEAKEVPYDELVRGFEYRRGEYLVLTDEELRAANRERSRAIEIASFVDAGSIEPIYYGHPYYLEPERGAAKSFGLFRKALESTGKVAVARFMLRTRERLAVLRPYGGALVLQELRFAHEVRQTDDLRLPAEQTQRKELELAISLVEKLSAQFDPSEYEDTHYETLRRLIVGDDLLIVPRRAGQETGPYGWRPLPPRRSLRALMT